jgi:30S ribosomal protein S31
MFLGLFIKNIFQNRQNKKNYTRKGCVVNGLPVSPGLETLLPVSLFLLFCSSGRSRGGGEGRRDSSMATRLAAAAFARRMAPARPPVPVAAAAVAVEAEAVTCGRGDKKTKRGKRFMGSFGNARPKKEKKIERIKDRVEVPRSTPWPLPFKLI